MIYAIVGAAMEVYRILGTGFLEPVYHEALIRELIERNILFETAKVPRCWMLSEINLGR
jgi:GxxExxY protein